MPTKTKTAATTPASTPTPLPAEPTHIATYDNEGRIITIPNTPEAINSRKFDALAACVDLSDLKAAGLGVSKTVFTDTVTLGKWRFQLRPVSMEIRLADDAFLKHSIEELGLEELVEQVQDFSEAQDPAKARFNAAVAVFAMEAFRYEHPHLSRRADELLAERAETVLLGTDPDSDEPHQWGGLVGWQIDGVPASEWPFSPQNARRLNMPTKAALRKRILSLSRGGEGDTQFRP